MANVWGCVLDAQTTATATFTVPTGCQFELHLKQAAIGSPITQTTAPTKKQPTQQHAEEPTTLYCTVDAPKGMGKPAGGGCAYTTVSNASLNRA
jgi:hypothetical protein